MVSKLPFIFVLLQNDRRHFLSFYLLLTLNGSRPWSKWCWWKPDQPVTH